MSPAPSRRKRGMISGTAASARMPASQSIVAIVKAHRHCLAAGCRADGERGEIEQLAVDADATAGHWPSARIIVSLRPGMLALDVVEHRLHGVALQPFLAAAEIARDDRESHAGGKFLEIRLGAIGERPQHHHVALVVEQLWRHGGKPAAMEQVHEEGFENVLAVMAEHQRRAALLARDAVEMAAPAAASTASNRCCPRGSCRSPPNRCPGIRCGAGCRGGREIPAGCALGNSAGPGRDCRRASRPAAARAISGRAARQAARRNPCRPTAPPASARRA